MNNTRPELFFNESDHTYWYGSRRVTSVTQAMALHNPFANVPASKLAYASARGSWVDEWITAYLTEHSKYCEATPYPNDPKSIMGVSSADLKSEYMTYVQSFLNWFMYHDVEAVIVQKPMYSEIYGYAGTQDFYGLIKGKWTVMDYKCTYAIPKSVGAQTAAYENLIREAGQPTYQRAVLHIHPSITRMRILDDPGDFNRFISLYNAYNIINLEWA